MKIRFGYSADPDDAFMFYALGAGKIATPGLEVELVADEIEPLNRRARAGELEATAISAAAYLMIADRYRLLDSGAAMGQGGGPIVAARESIDPGTIGDHVVAIPGSHTTASLLLSLYCGDPAVIEVAFERIPSVVRDGQADFGLLIHEGQLTHASAGLVKVFDLGEAWRRDTGLPLPLGVNVARRDLGEDVARQLSRALRDSIAWARANRDEALDAAMRYARAMDRATCGRFVDLFVNEHADTLGHTGRAALERLFAAAQRRRLVETAPAVDPV
jgi:1,4-dihydroxy-6-naphthoate synthase